MGNMNSRSVGYRGWNPQGTASTTGGFPRPTGTPIALAADTSSLRKSRYKAGEKISYEGLVLRVGGTDVTGACSLAPAEGTPFPRDEKRMTVTATYSTPNGQTSTATFELSRRRGVLLPIAIVLLAAAAIVAGLFAAGIIPWGEADKGETGTYLIPQGDMTDEEAQALVNEMAEKSRITVSVAPNMLLTDDNKLRVNFIVPEGNNGLAERLEVTQGDVLVAKTGVVKPGYGVEYLDVSQRPEVGPAIATVYAVRDDTEVDTGNPISVDVQIVLPGFQAGQAAAEQAPIEPTDGQVAAGQDNGQGVAGQAAIEQVNGQAIAEQG